MLGKEVETLTTYIIQRHANAVLGDDDLVRPLSHLGRQQANTAQQMLRDMRLTPAALIVSSTAIRAIRTVAIDGFVRPLTELYGPETKEDEDEMRRLFTTLGYASLRRYQKADTTDVLTRWVARAFSALQKKMQKWKLSSDAIVRVGCHGVVSNLLAIHLLVCGNEIERVRDIILGEAGALIITNGMLTGTVVIAT